MNSSTIEAYKDAIINRNPLWIVFFALNAFVIWFVIPINLVIKLA